MSNIKRPPMVQKLKAKLSSNEKISLVDFKIPLGNETETPLLKSVLEESVDDKYYLRHEIVEKILKETDFQERLVSIKIKGKE